MTKCIYGTQARNGAHFGIEVADIKVNFGKVMERMRKIRSRISHHDSCKRYASELGVDVYQVERLCCVNRRLVLAYSLLPCMIVNEWKGPIVGYFGTVFLVHICPAFLQH